DQAWRVIFPEEKQHIGHTEFWEQTVSKLVAAHFHIPPMKLLNLPYSQRRARIVGNTIYHGENAEPELLLAIRQAVGNHRLVVVQDNHEKRLKEDVLAFRRLVRRYAINGLGQ